MTDAIQTMKKEINDLDYCYGRAQKNKDYQSMQWCNDKKRSRREAIKALETRIKINKRK